VSWLAVSIVLSVVLTIVLNVVIRLFPHTTERAASGLADLAAPRPDDDRRVRVYAPWKAMLVASLLLTVALNALLWLR